MRLKPLHRVGVAVAAVAVGAASLISRPASAQTGIYGLTVQTIAPGETAWNTTLNIPSMDQQKNIIEFEQYVEYTKCLEYTEEPDYEMLRGLFNKIIKNFVFTIKSIIFAIGKLLKNVKIGITYCSFGAFFCFRKLKKNRITFI